MDVDEGWKNYFMHM